jgi:serine/threonine-protein kinase RsbW
MPAREVPLTLVLPSELRFLAVARAFMESVCQAGRLDQCVTDAVLLAVHEAISNVIRHAHREQPETSFHLHCTMCCDRMEIEILDEGEPFDLASVPDMNPSELRIGGRGVFLMRTLMDELSCRPRGERGNVLHMVKLYRENTRLPDCG